MLFALIVTGVSCNSKSDDTESDIVYTYSTVAIKNFSIKANDSVMKNLDSVFFSIDLNTGVIFNADSLPKGTNVTRLIPVITFSNTMSVAELSFLKDNRTDTVVNYLTNPNDSIDFTNPVMLKVTAADGANTFTYQIRVNVHQQDPDTLIWNKMEMADLPSAKENPVAQKTIYKVPNAYCLIEENDATFTLWSSSDLNEGVWNQLNFNPGFVPVVNSFTAASSDFYILDSEGRLYISEDLQTWQPTGEVWTNILGGYQNSVLGIELTDGYYYHTQYPLAEEYKKEPVSVDFPVTNSSAMGLIETEWASKPMVILAGGVTSDNKLSGAVWGFDGKVWAILNDGYLPALESPMLARYVVYRETNSLFIKREFDVWLLFGGFTEDGEMNRKVYMSYDNGVSWSLAPDLMQLSDQMPDLLGADVIVAGYPLSADLSEAWTPKETARTRSSYTIVGYDITWMCPYLYVFGGYENYPDNSLNTHIYRGVLERLRFTPNI